MRSGPVFYVHIRKQLIRGPIFTTHLCLPLRTNKRIMLRKAKRDLFQQPASAYIYCKFASHCDDFWRWTK